MEINLDIFREAAKRNIKIKAGPKIALWGAKEDKILPWRIKNYALFIPKLDLQKNKSLVRVRAGTVRTNIVMWDKASTPLVDGVNHFFVSLTVSTPFNC